MARSFWDGGDTFQENYLFWRQKADKRVWDSLWWETLLKTQTCSCLVKSCHNDSVLTPVPGKQTDLPPFHPSVQTCAWQICKYVSCSSGNQGKKDFFKEGSKMFKWNENQIPKWGQNSMVKLKDSQPWMLVFRLKNTYPNQDCFPEQMSSSWLPYNLQISCRTTGVRCCGYWKAAAFHSITSGLGNPYLSDHWRKEHAVGTVTATCSSSAYSTPQTALLLQWATQLSALTQLVQLLLQLVLYLWI